jgi:hypothetical protein
VTVTKMLSATAGGLAEPNGPLEDEQLWCRLRSGIFGWWVCAPPDAAVHPSWSGGLGSAAASRSEVLAARDAGGVEAVATYERAYGLVPEAAIPPRGRARPESDQRAGIRRPVGGGTT